jgi:hypothetical protein
VMPNTVSRVWSRALRAGGWVVVAALVVSLVAPAGALTNRRVDFVLLCLELLCGLAVVSLVVPRRSARFAAFLLTYTWVLLQIAIMIWATTRFA